MLRCLSLVSVVAVVLGVAAVVSPPRTRRIVNRTRRRRSLRRPELMPIRTLTYHAGFSTS
jgi:hypothetical protein